MSRIGKKPIPIKSGVEVKVNGGDVNVKGPLGQLTWTLAEGMSVEVGEGTVQVNRGGETKTLKALHGLTRAELDNLIQGVSTGYEKILELTGVGYRAQIQGQTLTLNVGYAHPIELAIPPEVKASVDKQTVITLKGIDKRKLSQTAAIIRGTRIPDVYKQKGIRYAGETLIKKAGKAGKK